jgi:hypothetical protein
MFHRARSSLLAALAPALVLAACGSKAASSGSTVPTTRPAPPAGATVVIEGKGDLDGKAGDEQLTLYSDGTLFAGNWVAHLAPQQPGELFRAEQAHLTVETLDAASGTRAVVVALPTPEDEDPPTRYRILVPRGGALVQIYDDILGVYGNTALRFPGDGTVHYTEDSWSACGSPHNEGGAMPTEPVPVHDITLSLDASGMLVHGAATATGETFDCNDLAACPWIYVDGPSGPIKVGEILRNVRGRAAYTLQDLALPAAAAGPLHLRVAEEEDEVTFLDEIYLDVDGLHVAPTACNLAAPPAYCVADHQAHRLTRGDVLDLTFELPASSTPTVFARGYYIPTPSRASR